MSDVALFGGSKIALKGAKDLAKSLKQVSLEDSGSSLPEGGVYISFSGKMGRYSIGEKKADADPAEMWVVNVLSFERGWVCWKGGQPVAKRMASVFSGENIEIDPTEHGPFDERRGDGWFRATAMMMKSLTDGTQGYFSTNTKSAVREMSNLTREVALRMEAGLPCWPVISLDKDEMNAAGHRNWKPKFNIHGWLYTDQLAALASVDDGDDGDYGDMEEVARKMLKEAKKREERGDVDALTADGSAASVSGDDSGEEDDYDIEPDVAVVQPKQVAAPKLRRQR